MNARPKSAKAAVEQARARMEADEIALLEALSYYPQGLGIASLASTRPDALEIVDRLVAKREVARNPGFLYNILAFGSDRLAAARGASHG